MAASWTPDPRLAAAVRGALAGQDVSDEALAEITAAIEDDPDLRPSADDVRKIEERVRELIGEYRRRVRVAVGSVALVASAVFTTTLCYRTGFHEGWIGFVGASPVAHETRGMAHGLSAPSEAPPPTAEAAAPVMLAGGETGAGFVGADRLADDRPPVVVLVDGAAITEVGWPIPRTLYARLIERLEGARAIAFDLPFADTDPDWGTVELVAAMRENGRVVLGAWLDTATPASTGGRRSPAWPEGLLIASAKTPGVKGIPRMTRAFLPDSRLVEAAAALGAVNPIDGNYLAYRGRAVPTLPLAARSLAGEGAAGPANGRGYAMRDVEVLSIGDVFAPGGADRVAGRVVYVGFAGLAGGEPPRAVQLAMR